MNLPVVDAAGLGVMMAQERAPQTATHQHSQPQWAKCASLYTTVLSYKNLSLQINQTFTSHFASQLIFFHKLAIY